MQIKKQNLIFVVLLITSFFNINSFAQEDSADIDDLFSEIKLAEPIMLEARIDVPLKINLRKALDLALENNLDIITARYEKNIHKWKYWENIGNWLPDYSLGFDARRFDGSFLIGGVFPVTTLSSSVNAFMRFDYRFFEGGRGLFNTLAAKKLYKGAGENLHARVNEILLSVTKAYNRLLKEQANLNVLAKAVEEAESEVELNTNLEREGVGTKFDILQSEEFLAARKQELIAQQAILRGAAVSLAALLNLDQGIHIQPDLDDLKIKDSITIDKSIDEFLAISKDNRPELKKKLLEYKANRNYIGVAFADFLPRVNFFGQYGGTGNVIFNRTKVQVVTPDAIQLDDEGNPVVQTVKRREALNQTFDPEVGLSNVTQVSNVIRGGGKPFKTTINDSLMISKFIGIEVDWILGDGLGVPTVSRINQARSQAKASKIALEKLFQNVEKEVRIAYLNVQATKKLLDVADKRIKAAKEALHLAKVRVQNGVGINTELISAQKQYTEALSSRVSAITDYNNAQTDLLYSLGLISIDRLL